MSDAAIINQIKSLNAGIVRQDPERLASSLQEFVQQGSHLHVLKKEEITVFYNSPGDYPGKEAPPPDVSDETYVAKTLEGLLASGAKFFDAVLYLSLPPAERPPAKSQAEPRKPGAGVKFPVFNDTLKITKFVFAVYFFIMICGHAPTDVGDYRDQPMPKFISTVLQVRESSAAIAEYLGSFPLSHLDPSWVKHIKVKGLSQKAASGLGRGVAGYRFVSVFNIFKPDLYNEENISEKPDWLDDAVEVAKSFKNAGPCWDFHPATRSPNLLSKYGNINKNASNLIRDCYKPETIKFMVESRKLPVEPQRDPAHTDYKDWNKNKLYVATSPIFESTL